MYLFYVRYMYKSYLDIIDCIIDTILHLLSGQYIDTIPTCQCTTYLLVLKVDLELIPSALK